MLQLLAFDGFRSCRSDLLRQTTVGKQRKSVIDEIECFVDNIVELFECRRCFHIDSFHAFRRLNPYNLKVAEDCVNVVCMENGMTRQEISRDYYEAEICLTTNYESRQKLSSR